MKQKKAETILYSVVGVAVMFFIVVAVNLISGAFKTRIDMTEEKAYTLDRGTRAILESGSDAAQRQSSEAQCLRREDAALPERLQPCDRNPADGLVFRQPIVFAYQQRKWLRQTSTTQPNNRLFSFHFPLMCVVQSRASVTLLL